MAILGVDCGHTASGVGYGAVGIRPESILTREVGRLVMSYLKMMGHTVVDCTVDKGSTLLESLAGIVAKVNNNKCDASLHIHFNCVNGTAYGTEVLVAGTGGKAEGYAKNVVDKIASLGFYNRGVKVRPELYVLKHTNCPAILIECCFCDSQKDMSLYNADKMARAIVEGFTGQKIPEALKPSGKLPNGSINRDAVVTADILNVRTGRGTNFATLGQLYKGATVNLWYNLNGWASIGFNGKTGYICTDYVALK